MGPLIVALRYCCTVVTGVQYSGWQGCAIGWGSQQQCAPQEINQQIGAVFFTRDACGPSSVAAVGLFSAQSRLHT